MSFVKKYARSLIERWNFVKTIYPDFNGFWEIFHNFYTHSLRDSEPWCNPEIETGKSYSQTCAECHGAKGEGVEDEFSKPLVGDWPLKKLIHYVSKTMPDYDPEVVTGKAEAVSKFIFEKFLQKPEMFRKESRINLPA